MRDIVFRGKTIGGEAWICGDLCQYSENVMGIKPHNMPHTVKVIPDTVGQYTGMKDKNGIRIFEGDIVRARVEETSAYMGFKWPPQKVEFKRGAFGVMDKWDRFTSFAGHTDIVTFEIIGNIYETPEEMEGNWRATEMSKTVLSGRVCDGDADTVGFAACPFCGGAALDIFHKDDFNFLDEKYSKASLHVRCTTCDVEMWEHTFDEHVYEKRLRLLAEKWNRRVNDEQRNCNR